MNSIFLISIYSLLLILLLAFVVLKVREETINLRKKYQGIVGNRHELKSPATKHGENSIYARTIQDMHNEKNKEKNYISESIAA